MEQTFNKTTKSDTQAVSASLNEKTIQNKATALQDNRPASILQRKANNTGLPDQLKSGIENLSGHSMDDVKVHYNSDKPAQLHAHAYAQGTDIHIASGQEKYLPHEAWHVVQQKQGRVKPTLQMKGKVNVNDDKGLEKEADVMGAKAIQNKSISHSAPENTSFSSTKNYGTATVQRFTQEDIKFMYENKFGLRHHGTKASAENEKLHGTEGGDAVPLNAIGGENPRMSFDLLRNTPIPVEVINKFIANVDHFISNSLNRTVVMHLGHTTPRQLIEQSVSKSTFLLVQGMNGTDAPKDIEKAVYGGLGKAGKQKINASQIIHLMALNDNEVDMEFMKFMHEDALDTPIQTKEEGEEAFSNLVMIFSEKLKDVVYKMRTGRDRFLVDI